MMKDKFFIRINDMGGIVYKAVQQNDGVIKIYWPRTPGRPNGPSPYPKDLVKHFFNEKIWIEVDSSRYAG